MLIQVVKTERWPLPEIQEASDELEGIQVLTTFRLFSEYCQIKMSERSKYMKTYPAPHNIYPSEGMPSALRNAPSTLQKIMDSFLRGAPLAGAHLDEWLFSMKTISAHRNHFHTILRLIAKNNLCTKLTRWAVAKAEVELLGHVIRNYDLMVNQSKIEVNQERACYTQRDVVQKLLGLAVQYLQFIKNFAGLQCTLYQMMSRNVQFKWDDKMQKAIENWKWG